MKSLTRLLKELSLTLLICALASLVNACASSDSVILEKSDVVLWRCWGEHYRIAPNRRHNEETPLEWRPTLKKPLGPDLSVFGGRPIYWNEVEGCYFLLPDSKLTRFYLGLEKLETEEAPDF